MGNALIVDDSSTERKILVSYLQELGITVTTAESGEEALDKLSSNIPDLIILDVVLPGKSGFEVCREIKAGANTAKVPVIICSTKGSEMDKFWGMKQGADAYIPKPVDKDELFSAVKKLIK
ncbi:MAG: response regulator [Cyanobacteria bacterium]|jgi:chemotaxis family two-component system response regulator PixH|nr:response regulator [Cyanobacteria bacterium CG_2015-16_32_12]NCO79132.1 response regulator [Cyanobacteria bacterium CG_2015-22_32_23]NCQ05241.1 response regulator [Cyanobacteria bacterium CG_2015-09_32_10]NCQ42457.1 response regulator [Cyanobacteria bacterium CG_2015-04_32_10]NCS86028.1 response regulator [Cyanobacteria bacterium CG_2015-02_32_10]